LLGLRRFFSFLILYTVSRTPWTGDQPVARPLPTHRTQTQNKRTQYTHPCLRWDSTHDPSVRASIDSACLRPRGHCDQRRPIKVSFFNEMRTRSYMTTVSRCKYTDRRMVYLKSLHSPAVTVRKASSRLVKVQLSLCITKHMPRR
jgi:hypothetical protein